MTLLRAAAPADTRTPAAIQAEVLTLLSQRDEDGRPVTHTMNHMAYRTHLTERVAFRRLQSAVRALVKSGAVKVYGRTGGRRTAYVHSANWSAWQEQYQTTPKARRSALVRRMQNLTDEQVAQVESLLAGLPQQG